MDKLSTDVQYEEKSLFDVRLVHVTRPEREMAIICPFSPHLKHNRRPRTKYSKMIEKSKCDKRLYLTENSAKFKNG